MHSSSRPLLAGSPPLGSPTPVTQAHPPAQEQSAPGPAPLAKVRQDLPAGLATSPRPLRQQAVAVGSRSDVKSSSQARSDAPTPVSRPGLLQIADLGAQHGQAAKAGGAHSTSPSAWFVALGVSRALPDLYRVGLSLCGTGLQVPPDRHDEQAMVRLAIASLALDPRAPLPQGEAMVDRLVDLSVPSGAENDAAANAMYHRLERVEYHLTALALQGSEPLDKQAPSRRFLTRLGALDQEIRSLLADARTDLPAPLRAELTRLGERVTAERGFAQQADAFVKAHDTGELKFEDIMAHMRHGTTAQQLHFLLFEQAVTAAYRASYVTGTPVVPPGIADGYQGLWRQAARNDTPTAGTDTPQPPHTTAASTTSMTSSSSTTTTSSTPPQLPSAADTVVDEPGYRAYTPNADLPE